MNDGVGRYKGTIAGYDQGTAKYKVVFPDGEEVIPPHTLHPQL